MSTERQLEEYRVQGKWDRVMRMVKQLEATRPILALELTGEVALRTNRASDARRALAKAEKMAPNNEAVIALLGEVEMLDRKFDDALAVLSRLRGDLNSATAQSSAPSNPTSSNTQTQITSPSSTSTQGDASAVLLSSYQILLVVNGLVTRAKLEDQLQKEDPSSLGRIIRSLETSVALFERQRLPVIPKSPPETAGNISFALATLPITLMTTGRFVDSVLWYRKALMSPFVTNPNERVCLAEGLASVWLRQCSKSHFTPARVLINTQLAPYIPNDGDSEMLLLFSLVERFVSSAATGNTEQTTPNPATAQSTTTQTTTTTGTATPTTSPNSQSILNRRISRVHENVYDSLTVVCCVTGNFAYLEEMYSRAQARGVDNRQKLRQFALALMSAGRYQFALQIFRQCLTHAFGATDAIAMLMAAKMCLKKKSQLEMCIQLCQQALGVKGHHLISAHHIMGLAYLKLAQTLCVSQRKECDTLALMSLGQAHKLDKHNPFVAYHLALHYAILGDLTNGLRFAALSLQLNNSRADPWNLLALLLSANQDLASATDTIDSALRNHPKNVELLLTRSRLRERAGDIQQAADALRHVIVLLHEQQQQMQQQQLQQQAQQQQQQQAQPLSQHTPSMQHQQSQTQWTPSNTQQGLWSPANPYSSAPVPSVQTSGLIGASGGFPSPRDELETPVSVASTEVDLCDVREHQRQETMATAWLYLAELFRNQNLLEDASKSIQAAQRFRFPPAEFHYQTGVLLKTQGKLREAAAEFKRALAANPDHLLAMVEMALVETTGESHALGMSLLQNAVRLDPSCHVAWYHLGTFLQEEGHHSEAADALLCAAELEASVPVRPFSCLLSSVELG